MSESRSTESSEDESGPDDTTRTYKLGQYTEDVEDLDGYCVGGYHPVSLGDILNGRYEIIHKLGFGSYAVVWLARDTLTATNVAVKILMADNGSLAESELLVELHREDSHLDGCLRTGKEAVATILDEFEVSGPNGLHRCLVSAAAKSSLNDAREWSTRRVFQLSTARAIIAQLVQAVDFIHGQGVIHGGTNNQDNPAKAPLTFYQIFTLAMYFFVCRRRSNICRPRDCTIFVVGRSTFGSGEQTASL